MHAVHLAARWFEAFRLKENKKGELVHYELRYALLLAGANTRACLSARWGGGSLIEKAEKP